MFTMRRITIVLVMLGLLVGCAPARSTPSAIVPQETPQVEGPSQPAQLTVDFWSEANEPVGGPDQGWKAEWATTEPGEIGHKIAEAWHTAHPEYAYLDINPLIAVVEGGRYGTELDSRIEKNDIPELFLGYGGRLGELAAQFGIDHTSLLNSADFADFNAMIASDGTIPLVLATGDYAYPIVNADLFREARVPVPEPWSIMTNEEYMAAAEAIKALDKEAWIGVWFANGRSSQHWNWGPMANVGRGNFSWTGEFLGFNDETSVALLTQYKTLFDEGYLHPGSVGMCDDDALLAFGEGKIGVMYARTSFGPWMWGVAIDAGIIKEPFEIVPLIGIEYVKDEHVMVNGNIGSSAIFIAKSLPEEYREAAMSFLLYAATYPHLEYRGEDVFINYLPYAENKGVIVDPVVDHSAIQEYMADGNFANDGITSPIYNRLRALWAEQMGAMLLSIKSPTEAAATYTMIGKSWLE